VLALRPLPTDGGPTPTTAHVDGGDDVTDDRAADEPSPAPSTEIRLALEGVSAAVFRVLRRMGVTLDEVDDAMQSVLIQLAGRWPELCHLPAHELRAYGCAAAAGVAVDVARRRSVRDARLVPLEADPVVDQPGPEDALEHQRELKMLDEILASIPADRRLVFILFEIEELGLQEIADRLAIPRGTVSSRLRKARDEFERAVARRRTADERRGRKR
jgi:RNA polymerase sigma-70 factor (ECF subfamily)